MIAPRKWWQETRELCRKHPRATACLLVGYVAMVAVGAYHFGYRNWWGFQRWKEAEQSLAVHDFRAAREQLGACLLVWSNDARTHFAMAQACRRLEDLEAAGWHLDKARRLGHPAAPIALEMVLIEVQRTGGGSAERAVLQPYLDARSPEEPLIMEALATGQHHQRHFREASRWFNRWVTLYPGDWRAYHFRGSFHLETGRLDAAKQDFEKALELRPDQLESQRSFGTLLALTGDDAERAVQLLEGYLRKRPDDHGAQITLARAQRRLTRSKEARQTLARLIAAGVANASLSLLMAQLDADEDNLSGALRWLETAKRQGTDDLEEIGQLYNSLSNVHRRLGQPDQALAYERRLEEFNENLKLLTEAINAVLLQGSDSDLSFRIAMLYLRLGASTEGVRWLEDLVRAYPQERRSYQALIDLFDKRPDTESQKRAADYRRLLAQLDPP